MRADVVIAQRQVGIYELTLQRCELAGIDQRMINKYIV